MKQYVKIHRPDKLKCIIQLFSGPTYKKDIIRTLYPIDEIGSCFYVIYNNKNYLIITKGDNLLINLDNPIDIANHYLDSPYIREWSAVSSKRFVIN